MKKILDTTLINFIDYSNKLPRDFNTKLYWQLNLDLQDKIDYLDSKKLYEDWINYGSIENRIYTIPDNIIYYFDYRVYFYLYDDIKQLYDINDIYGLLYHYYKYGLHNNRICNIDNVDKYINNNHKYNIKKSSYNKFPNLIISKSHLIKLNYYKELYIQNQNNIILLNSLS